VTVARLGLFAYGSLVSPESASETLGRPVEASAVARLGGWRRRWSTLRDNRECEKTFARRDNGGLPGYVLGLNLEPSGDEAEAPNGVILELTEAELERLDVRELRYARFEVTRHLGQACQLEAVFAYRAKPAHFAARPPHDAIVIASYAAFVESAFQALGPGQGELYLETTGPPPVEVVEAVLVEDRIPAGNPRRW